MNKNYLLTKYRRKYSIKQFIIILIFVVEIFLINKYKVIQRLLLIQKINVLPNYFKEILYYYFTNDSLEYNKVKYTEINNLILLFSLNDFSKLTNNITKHKMKIELLNELQKKPKKLKVNSSFEDKIVYVDKSFNFGNSLVLLNNLIYYCEILNLKNIYLNSNYKWPISQNISYGKMNISLISTKSINLKKDSIIIFDRKLIYFQKVFKPEIRINILKTEIKRYLPEIKVNENDLYIHIRGGDIFGYKAKGNINYAQPPLCLYLKVITNFKFKYIFILSMDSSNPIIKLLIREYPQIILTHNSLEIDISILINAFNLIGSMSSFLTSIIILNENLRNFFEYDNYSLSQKYLHLHHDIYKYKINYSIYKIKASTKYLKEMFPWKNSKEQRKLMINEKCNDFIKIDH